MGEKARQKPKRLAEKLLQIRRSLGLSQNELIKRMGVDLHQNRISDYETGKGEPSLLLLLGYARLVGVSTDILIDDEVDLPSLIKKRTTKKGGKR
jgi:transcriptional regulator with XRE-family HTH domain